MVSIINWRDVQPDISHLSAVHWGGYRLVEEGSDDSRDRLENLVGFARHSLQGRKTSDYHKHAHLEQVYYVLSGHGEILFDDKRYTAEAGDAVYLPPHIHHQMINDNESWLEHHVISAHAEAGGSEILIRNWKDVPPIGDGAGAIRWHQLGRAGQDDVGCLRGMDFIDRESIQPGGTAIERCFTDIEQVYYVLENRGVFQSNGEDQEITEGDMIHVPRETTYKISNPHQEWLSYMIMAG